MVRVEDDVEIPESGAVFTFGKSKFSDNVPSKFWIRNDAIVQVACGDEHSIVVTENGRCYVFGSNSFGQLGLGHTKNVTKPTCIKALKQVKVVCAAGGRSHSLIATESGAVYSFGANSEGQLGLGDNSDRIQPTVIGSIEEQVKMVTAGSYHSAVVTASGKLFIFGSNSEGQLGLDDTKNVATPTELQLAVNITWTACGYYHTAVVGDGKLFLFGEKEGGKLGLLDKQLQKKTNRPQCIFSITEKVSMVSCGGNHTAALTDCGKLYTFGSGINGQLALGTMIMETGAPSLVGALDGEKVISVSCGESHTAFVTERRRLYTCGDGRHGKLALGNDNFSNQFNPVYVKKFTGFFVHKVACGGCHMLVLASKQLDNDTYNESTGDCVNYVQDGVDLGLAARNRRRQKEMIGQRPLPNIDPSLSLGQNTNFESVNKKDDQQEKMDDLQQLEKQLTEMDKNYENAVATNADDDADSVLSEVSQFNKTHEFSLVGKNDSELVPLKKSTSPTLKVERIRESENRIKVNVVNASLTNSANKDVRNQREESEEEEEEESETTEEDDEEVEEADSKSAEKNTKEKAEHPASENGEGKSTSENNKPAEKKESFLKKMFSFKKRKAKLKSEVIVTQDKTAGNEDAANPAAETKPTLVTALDSSKADENTENDANKDEESKVVSASEKSDDSEKKTEIKEVTDKKSGSAKSVKEKSKSVASQSSKACNVL